MLDPLLVVEPGGQRCFDCDKPFLSLSWPTSDARPAQAVYVAAALALLATAQPIDWDTPTNLEYEMGWGFYVVVIVIIAGVLGALEGGFLGRGHPAPRWLFTALAAGVGVSGAAFFIDEPFAYGDEVWTASSGDAVMSQGLVRVLDGAGRRCHDLPRAAGS